MKRFFTLFFLCVTSYVILTSKNSANSVTGNTGLSGSDCSGCHGGGAGTTSLTVSLNGQSTSYKSDSTYTCTVTVTNPSLSSKHGFSLVAVNSSNTSVGTITVGAGQVKSTGALVHIGHSTPSVSSTFTFTYKAPSAATYTGNINFYISGIAANGNGSTSGDVTAASIISFSHISDADINIKQGATSIANNGSYSYANTGIGSNTNAIFTIENVGATAQALSLSAFNITGTNASDFTIVGATPTSIAGGSSSNITVKFTPGSIGSKTANLVINSNDPDENPTTIVLNGTGITTPGGLTVTQNGNSIPTGGSYNFGSVKIPNIKDVTIIVKNTGGTAITFAGMPSITGPNMSDFTLVSFIPAVPTLNPGDSVVGIIRFIPSSFGAKTALISVPYANPGLTTYTATLTGFGMAPKINLKQAGVTYNDSSIFNFGNVKLNTTLSKTFTIENLGNDTLNVSNIVTNSFGTATYTVTTPTTLMILPSATGTFIVQYSPALANGNGILTISSDDPNNNLYGISLDGTATYPEMAVSQSTTTIQNMDSYSFGPVTIGTPLTKTFTITNTGNDTLKFTSASFFGTDQSMFSTTTNFTTLIVLPGGTGTFNITFNPSTNGSKFASIIMNSNDGTSPAFTIDLDGSGIGTTLNEINVKQNTIDYLTGSTFSYGNKFLNGSHDTTFVIHNTGSSPLTVTNAVLSGPNASSFSIISTFPKTISAGMNANCIIRFSPTTLGSKSTVLTLTNDDVDEGTYVINIGGVAVTPEINIKQNGTVISSNGNYSFAPTFIASTTDALFSIENTGNGTLTGVNASLIGANASEYSIQTPSAVNINASSTSNLLVRFAPTSSGNKICSLSVSSNDLDENPYIIIFNSTANIVPSPEIDITDGNNSQANGATYNFGKVTTLTDKTVSFVMKNTGTAALNSIKATISGADSSQFVITVAPPVVIGNGQQTNFNIRCSPKSEGAKTAFLRVVSNDADENPYIINLSCLSVSPEIEVHINDSPQVFPNDSFISIKNVAIDSTAKTKIKLINKGTAVLENITAILAGIDNTHYSITNSPPATIAAGDSFTFVVNFHPHLAKARNVTLVITSNDVDEGYFKIYFYGNNYASLTDLEKEMDILNTNNTISISSKLNSKIEYVLYDMKGVEVIKNSFTQSIDINMESLPKEVYIMTLKEKESGQMIYRKVNNY